MQMNTSPPNTLALTLLVPRFKLATKVDMAAVKGRRTHTKNRYISEIIAMVASYLGAIGLYAIYPALTEDFKKNPFELFSDDG